MGLFNFIETFFFISLGITFILILLLVYHFKQRLSNLEQKNDSMIYIVNNLVKELTTVKQISNMIMCNRPPPNISNHSPCSFLYNDFIVKEEDEEDYDTDCDDDTDTDTDTDDEDDEVKILILDDDEMANPNTQSIYVIPSSVVELNSPLPDEENEKLLVDTASPCSISDNSSGTELSWNDLALGESKLEHLIPITTEGETSHWGEIDESYKKMSIPELRSIVVSKGLTQDASKMKKIELFKLLQV